MPSLKKVIVYTDGSARSNPDGPGGYGAVLYYTDPNGKTHSRQLSQGYERTTNNRMEMMAVISALEALKPPCDVTIHSDSQYVVNAFEKGWLDNWQKKNWKRGKEPVKNVDLWKRMLKAMEGHAVHFEWVRGHAGNPDNETCDRLATSAADNGPWLKDEGYAG
ncbi:MAG: ribonuclease HI [Eubacterium sp.]|nr:ribonuclease HI [Eubacterium sp.]